MSKLQDQLDQITANTRNLVQPERLEISEMCIRDRNGEGKPVLHSREVVLPHGLWGDPNEQRAALAHRAVQIPPGLKLGDTVRAPAPAEEVDDQRPDRQQVRAAHDAAPSVGQGKLRGLRANLQDSILYPRCICLLYTSRCV